MPTRQQGAGDGTSMVVLPPGGHAVRVRQEATYRRRRAAALGTAAVLVVAAGATTALIAGGGDKGHDAVAKGATGTPGAAPQGAPGPTGAHRAAKAAPVQLPRGGRRLFPDRRIVAYYGNPRDRELG